MLKVLSRMVRCRYDRPVSTVDHGGSTAIAAAGRQMPCGRRRSLGSISIQPLSEWPYTDACGSCALLKSWGLTVSLHLWKTVVKVMLPGPRSVG